MYGDGGAAADNNYSHLHHQQQQRSGGLTRFSSAPVSCFQTLLDDPDIISIFTATGSDEIRQPQQQQPFSVHQDHHQSRIVKHETHQRIDLSSSLVNNNGFSASRNSGGLLRQSSSPADFFSTLFDDNNDAVGFPSYRRDTQAPHFSANQPMPSIPEFQQNDSISGSLDGLFEKADSYAESWQGNAAFAGQMRTGDSGNEIRFGASNELGNQNGYTANPSNGLIHQMSLPNTSSELAAMDKYLQFQEASTPCSNTRAKRGFATHPRSIAERVRRTKISDRMRKLQQLFPDIDKQTNTAQMLDMATDYIKDLEKEVQSLKDAREKCKCLKM